MVAGFVLIALGRIVAQVPEARPVFKSERYEENWSFLEDRAKRQDLWDPLKYVPLGRTGWYATLAGEGRLRYEILDQPGFGRGPQDQNGYLLQRYLLSSDIHLGKHLRTFVELQSALSVGRTGGPRVTDVNRLDLGQAFLEFSTNETKPGKFIIRAGRQEVGFGTGHLISPAEGLNVRRAFDGLRLIWERKKWTFNAVALKLTDAHAGVFDDVPDHQQAFWGAGAIGSHPLWRKANVSFYYLGLDKRNAQFSSGSGRQIRHTAGSRSWRNDGAWDASYEAIVQWGSFAGRTIHAWALASDTGYTLKSLSWRPRVGLRANATSGDRNPADRSLNSFDPLFPSAVAYSGSSGLLGPVNLLDVTPSLRAGVTSRLTVLLDTPVYWRQSTGDGIYSVFVTPLRSGSQNRARFVGMAPALNLTWQLDRHISTTVLYSRFLTGTFFKGAPPERNVNFFALSAAYKF